jgi:competence ComEA-like helix-hairpin-helix protein
MRGFADWLALTPSERTVILFLLVAFAAGIGVRFTRSLFASPPNFDYSASDSTYAAVAAALDDPEPEPETKHTGPVRINTAGKTELMTLPGVGEKMAERILLERTERGPFRSVDDLKRVRGIGAKRIEQLKPLVTLD